MGQHYPHARLSSSSAELLCANMDHLCWLGVLQLRRSYKAPHPKRHVHGALWNLKYYLAAAMEDWRAALLSCLDCPDRGQFYLDADSTTHYSVHPFQEKQGA